MYHEQGLNIMVGVINEHHNHPSKSFRYPTVTEWNEYHGNIGNDETDIHSHLKENLKHTIESTPNQRSKLGLKIILMLISHPKKDVRAFSLGKLYPLLTEDSLRRLIIEDLREMYDDPYYNVHKAAEESLDYVSEEIYNLKIPELILETFTELEKNLKTKISSFTASFASHHHHPPSPNSPNKYKISLTKKCRQFNILLDKIIFSDELEDIFPELGDVEDFSMGDIIDKGVIPYSDISHFQWRPADSIERIAATYAHTFMEKGHLHHLKTYLDDEDYVVRQIGVNALLSVVEFLFDGSKEKSRVEYAASK